MKRTFLLLLALLIIINKGLTQTIRLSTCKTDLIFKVADNGRLYQSYFGEKLLNASDIEHLPMSGEAYVAHGMEDYFEPAIRVLHCDGNPSLLLTYVDHKTTNIAAGISETVVSLRDKVYGTAVDLCFTLYEKENVIKSHAVISHTEKKAITIYNYASSLLQFNREKYFLTEFSGDWAHEVNMSEQQLTFGKKMIDTKLGTRANMFCSPFFVLSLDKNADEKLSEVLLGTLAWTGNFRFTFEVDNLNRLRVLSSINPYASEYILEPNTKFITPEFIFTLSQNGTGEASRDFHRWARTHQLKDGEKGRMTLLNNWEATYFNFDQDKLCKIIGEAADLGVDMFLLDDGWFANKYPRKNDRQGLGDWDVTKSKLPEGIAKLIEVAEGKNVKFGLWIEPEMVSHKSELYEKHKDWVIHLPNRDEYYFRSQMVLDLCNPKVQDYVFGVVDKLMIENPKIAYLKWDCNSPITNIYSPYLKDKQSQLYIDYVRGFYNILERIKVKYPQLDMMLCSGGGGRSDYEALKYFTEFWASDNTDPVERLFIQWGFSHFFPSKSIAAHVTSWSNLQSVKFKTDVASMCRLGFDIRTEELSQAELQYCRAAIANFNRLQTTLFDGDLYRLVSPYSGNHSALMYVGGGKEKAVMFAFDVAPRYAENICNVLLEGLDAAAEYKVEEINLMPEAKSRF
ncbi:MAG: alpha-galactosidase, partial [Rikenellaceae bacterium]